MDETISGSLPSSGPEARTSTTAGTFPSRIEGRHRVAAARDPSPVTETWRSKKLGTGSVETSPEFLWAASMKGWSKMTRSPNQLQPRPRFSTSMSPEGKPPGKSEQVSRIGAFAAFLSADWTFSEVTKKVVTAGYFGALTNRVNLLS